MKRVMKLETISYKNNRAKFDDKWFTLSPFLDLKELQFGTNYEISLVMDTKGLWYVEELKPVVEK